jgi:hypothetical protein
MPLQLKYLSGTICSNYFLSFSILGLGYCSYCFIIIIIIIIYASSCLSKNNRFYWKLSKRKAVYCIHPYLGFTACCCRDSVAIFNCIYRLIISFLFNSSKCLPVFNLSDMVIKSMAVGAVVVSILLIKIRISQFYILHGVVIILFLIPLKEF